MFQPVFLPLPLLSHSLQVPAQGHPPHCRGFLTAGAKALLSSQLCLPRSLPIQGPCLSAHLHLPCDIRLFVLIVCLQVHERRDFIFLFTDESLEQCQPHITWLVNNCWLKGEVNWVASWDIFLREGVGSKRTQKRLGSPDHPTCLVALSDIL